MFISAQKGNAGVSHFDRLKFRLEVSTFCKSVKIILDWFKCKLWKKLFSLAYMLDILHSSILLNFACQNSGRRIATNTCHSSIQDSLSTLSPYQKFRLLRFPTSGYSVGPQIWKCQIWISCRWVPVYADREQRLGVMSIGFLLENRDDAVIWRGPKKNGKFIYLFILKWSTSHKFVLDAIFFKKYKVSNFC